MKAAEPLVVLTWYNAQTSHGTSMTSPMPAHKTRVSMGPGGLATPEAGAGLRACSSAMLIYTPPPAATESTEEVQTIPRRFTL